MVDLFGKKEIATLEVERKSLQTRLSELEYTNNQASTDYIALQTKYSVLQTTSGEQGTRISGLETAVQTTEGRILELEARLTQLPNREITTLKAIQDLAKGRSDEGYDAFLKDIIRELVDKGVTAYESTLHQKLRGSESRQYQRGEDPFPTLIADTYYAGFNALDKVTKPTVNFIGVNFPYLDEKEGSDNDPHSTKGAIKKHYGSSKPQVVLRFRNEHEAQHCRSRQQETDMLANLTPEEWQRRLEMDKDILLQAFGFGFVASYYEDVRENPQLPTVLENLYKTNTWDVPARILEMQERAKLIESPSLLQDLYECVQGANPKFSAGVLGYFKQN